MNALLDSAGLWLRDITSLSWKGALLALFVGASIQLLRRRLSPAWRHGLWLLVLVRLAVPDLGTSPWSMSRWMVVPRPAESPSASIAATRLAAPRLAAPLPPSTQLEPLSMTEVPLEPAPPEERGGALPMRHPIPWTSWQWLTLVWLLGVGIVIGLMVMLHLRMRHRVRRDRTEPSSNALASLRDACALARVKRAPALIVTDAVRAPALFGIVRPAILLPRELAASCHPASLNLILLHELAHLQRRDLWAQVAAALVMALHWFNPVVWWTGRRLRAEAEMAADARALRCTDANEAHRMGELLLRFANGAAAGWIVWFAAATVLGISGNKRNMRRRIEALMDLARGRRSWWLMGLAAFVALAVTGLTKAPAEDAKKAPAATTTVTGIVLDETGKPIQGATCMLAGGKENSRPRTIQSDAEGRFRFEGVPNSVESRLSAHHDDYLKARPPFIKISGRQQEEFRIVLTRATGWLSGTVTRKADGTPIKDATVGIRQESTLPILLLLSLDRENVKTDESGRYRVRNTVGTRGLVLIDASGMAFTAQEFTLKEGELTLDRALEPDTGLTGKVTNTEGKPVEDAVVCLSSRTFFLDPSRPPAKLTKTDNYMIGSGYWMGKPTTDEHGAFAGRRFDTPSSDKAWLIAYHPTEGVQRVRLRDWTSGGTMKLDRWNTVHGTLTDRDGKAVSGAKVEFWENELERDAEDNSISSLFHRTSTTTDQQGQYKLDQILPRSQDSRIRVNGTFVSARGFPLGAGETKDLNLRLPPKVSVPAEQLRRVIGRVVVPSGHTPTRENYEIPMTIGVEGGGNSKSLYADYYGRFETYPLEPGNYQLHITVKSKDRKLLPPLNAGVSMRFKLERDDEHQTLDLGDITLDADNFEFHPDSPKTATAKAPPRPRQSLDAPVAQGASFATWAGSGGNGAGAEQAVAAGGRIVGKTPVSSNLRFIIRGTKADGTRHFTAAQVANEDASETINGPLSFYSGVAVLGQIHGLPADYAGDGWIVAADEVDSDPTPGALVKGRIPMLTWHAWAPVQRDGKFQFAALPRGGVFLIGFGNGWTTNNGTNSGTMFHVNLTGAEPLTKVDIDTKATLEQRVRLLLPDGSSAAGAAISVSSVSNTRWDRAFGHWGHDVDDKDRNAYERYKNTSIPGHSAVTDAGGLATLRNQLYERYAKTMCEVKWTDPQTKASHVEKVEIQIRANTEGPQEVKLTGKSE